MKLAANFCKKNKFTNNISVDQRSGANLKKRVFAKICCKFVAFISFFAKKMLKMTISTSVWSGQHINAGGNIQQPTITTYALRGAMTHLLVTHPLRYRPAFDSRERKTNMINKSGSQLLGRF